MSDETEDTLDARLEQMRRRAETFRDLLKDGDAIVVAMDAGELHVDEIEHSRLARKHPKLFGRLLAVEAQLNLGVTPIAIVLLLFSGFVLGLQVDWWSPLIGERTNEALNQWWFWIAELIAVWFLVKLACTYYRTRIYAGNRGELVERINAEGLDRDELLVMLDGADAELAYVVEAMKHDRGPFGK